jgi:hypothetical protein
MRPALFVACLTALALSASAFGRGKGKWVSSDDWNEFCEQAKKAALPPEDQPGKEALAGLKGCDAEALYYGIGAPPDYAKARLCAYAQLAFEEDTIVFGGNAILMMIYANGQGVKANAALAERFTCEFHPSSPTEIDSRLERLEAVKSGEVEAQKFDVCDEVTSGSMKGFCRSHDERLAEGKRAAELEALVATWAEPEKAAFKTLKAASEKFVEALPVRERTSQKMDLMDSLRMFESGQAPKYTAQQAKAENQKLVSLYQRIEKSKARSFGTVTRDGIHSSQKAWAEYRQAWIELSKAKFRSYPPESIAAWLDRKWFQLLSRFARVSP